jgi:ABC-type transport system involved in cytochrome bd biosynthesis fused ATPase/permease subunit
VDPATETAMLEQLKPWFKDRVVLLISHRLRHFPEFDHVLYLESGTGIFSDHESLLKSCPGYAERYLQQTQGGDLDEQR